jgi:hypothetical protein
MAMAQTTDPNDKFKASGEDNNRHREKCGIIIPAAKPSITAFDHAEIKKGILHHFA